MIQVEFFNKRKEFSCFAKAKDSIPVKNVINSYIVTNVPRTKEDVFDLLHELGHAADKKIIEEQFFTLNTWNNELRAWAYAVLLTCPCQKEALYKYAIPCLDSYARVIHETQYLSLQEISFQLDLMVNIRKEEMKNEKDEQNSINMDSRK